MRTFKVGMKFEDGRIESYKFKAKKFMDVAEDANWTKRESTKIISIEEIPEV